MNDEQIYNEILDELRSAGPREGLWAKCFSETNGDVNAAKALYFKYHAEQISNDKSNLKNISASTVLANHNVEFKNTNSIKTASSNRVSISRAILIIVVVISIAYYLKAKDDSRMEQALEFQSIDSQMLNNAEEQAQREVKRAKLKIVFSGYFKDQTNFKFPAEMARCGNETSNAGYSHCLFVLAKKSRAKLNDQRDKLFATTNDNKFTQAITKTYLLEEKLVDSWCNTFTAATWGGGSGTGQGVASCELTVNEWFGQAIYTVANAYIGGASSDSATFKTTEPSLLLNIVNCFDEKCKSEIVVEALENIKRYETEIASFLLTQRAQKKYEFKEKQIKEKLIEPSNIASESRKELINLICENIFDGYEISIGANYKLSCQIGLNSYWLSELKNTYENLIAD